MIKGMQEACSHSGVHQQGWMWPDATKNQGRTVVEQLTEETTDTPGYATGQAIGQPRACYRAQRGQVSPGCWPRGASCPGFPPQLILSGQFTDEHSDPECGWQNSRQADYTGAGAVGERTIHW